MKPYRDNVGAILRRADGDILLAERIDEADAWQFPQGGVDAGESKRDAMWREVSEELGLREPRRVCEVVAVGPATTYDFPPDYTRPIGRDFRGQRQTLFLLDFAGTDELFDLDRHHAPEFQSVRWVRPSRAVDLIIPMKRVVLERTVEARPSFFAS